MVAVPRLGFEHVWTRAAGGKVRNHWSGSPRVKERVNKSIKEEETAGKHKYSSISMNLQCLEQKVHLHANAGAECFGKWDTPALFNHPTLNGSVPSRGLRLSLENPRHVWTCWLLPWLAAGLSDPKRTWLCSEHPLPCHRASWGSGIKSSALAHTS